MTYDKDAETVCLEFASELAVGEVTFSFAYTGCLNDQMRGFYRSKYTVDGEERYAAVTQFEVRYSTLTIPISGSSFFHSPYHRLQMLVGRCLAGMSRPTRLRLMWCSSFPKTESLSQTWCVSDYFYRLIAID